MHKLYLNLFMGVVILHFSKNDPNYDLACFVISRLYSVGGKRLLSTHVASCIILKERVHCRSRSYIWSWGRSTRARVGSTQARVDRQREIASDQGHLSYGQECNTNSAKRAVFHSRGSSKSKISGKAHLRAVITTPAGYDAKGKKGTERGVESSQGGENDDAPDVDDRRGGDGEARPPPSHHHRRRIRYQPGDAESAGSFVLKRVRGLVRVHPRTARKCLVVPLLRLLVAI
jgi:hypothetical protein